MSPRSRRSCTRRTPRLTARCTCGARSSCPRPPTCSNSTPPSACGSRRSARDDGLAALAFHYGRYLLIASSQPGGLPITLQGLWNAELPGPWSSAYTININTQMAYWPAETPTSPSATSRCSPSRGGWPRRPVPIVARELYGADGWVAHHNSDAWALRGARRGRPRRPGVGELAAWAACGSRCTCGTTTRSGSTRRTCATRHGRCSSRPRASRCRGSPSTANRVDRSCHLAREPLPRRRRARARRRRVVDDDGRRALREARRGLPSPRPTCSASTALARGAHRAHAGAARPARVGAGRPHRVGPRATGCRARAPARLAPDRPVPARPDHAGRRRPSSRAPRARSLELRGPESTGWSLAWRAALRARLGDGDAVHELVLRRCGRAEPGTPRTRRARASIAAGCTRTSSARTRRSRSTATSG